MSQPKSIQLTSSDGEIFEVDEVVAIQSETIKHLIEGNCTIKSIPFPNVTGKVMAKVIEYCKKHAFESTKVDVLEFDKEFVKVDRKMLFDLILAADYLHIKSLLDLTCKAVADMIATKTPEEIREIFNIKNDFTPEEEAEIRREVAWVFQ